MNKQTKMIVALSINFIVIILEVISLITSIVDQGLLFIEYYTQDSNIIALFACIIISIEEMLVITNKKHAISRFSIMFKYIACAMLTITFLVVLFVLAPMTGSINGFKFMFLSGTMLYYHLLCPILVFISFVLFEEGKIESKDLLYVLIPTLVYAIITITLNIFKIMEGPYPFLRVYDQEIYMSIIWFVIIIGGAFLISLLIKIIKARINNKE